MHTQIYTLIYECIDIYVYVYIYILLNSFSLFLSLLYRPVLPQGMQGVRSNGPFSDMLAHGVLAEGLISIFSFSKNA